MLTILALVIVLGLAVVFIGLPLLRNDEVEEELVLTEGDPRELEKEKVFSTLSDIEYDYQMKKLSESDYQELKNRYTKRAIEILKEEEETGQYNEDDVEAEAEAEIEAELAGLLGEGDDVPATPAAPTPKKASGGKGRVTAASDDAEVRFCANCGAKLLNPNQRFCHSCGGKIDGR